MFYSNWWFHLQNYKRFLFIEHIWFYNVRVVFRICASFVLFLMLLWLKSISGLLPKFFFYVYNFGGYGFKKKKLSKLDSPERSNLDSIFMFIFGRINRDNNTFYCASPVTQICTNTFTKLTIFVWFGIYIANKQKIMYSLWSLLAFPGSKFCIFLFVLSCEISISLKLFLSKIFSFSFHGLFYSIFVHKYKKKLFLGIMYREVYGWEDVLQNMEFYWCEWLKNGHRLD